LRAWISESLVSRRVAETLRRRVIDQVAEGRPGPRGYPDGYLGLEIPKKSFAFEENTSIVAFRRIGANRRTGLPTSTALEVHGPLQ